MAAEWTGKLTEYRIVLPMDMEEFRTGHLWSIANASIEETGGGEGIEIVINEPFAPDDKEAKARGIEASGQYTHKIYHLASKVPIFIRQLAPQGMLEIREKSWNSFPKVRTEFSNPEYMKDGFHIIVESIYAPDRGTSENIFNLNADQLARREVVNLNITADDQMPSDDKRPEWDPCKVRSEKAGRGPLPGNSSWSNTVEPVMCCYKLCSIKFDWWGLKDKTENIIERAIRRLYMKFHRQLVCWMDNYYGMTMEDIREMEKKTKRELEVIRAGSEVHGMIVR